MAFRISLILICSFIFCSCSSSEETKVSKPVPHFLKTQYQQIEEVDVEEADDIRTGCVNSCKVKTIPEKKTTMTTPMGEVPRTIEAHQVLSSCCAVIEHDGRYFYVVHHDQRVEPETESQPINH